jgi:aromatic-L-amino-acid decarboxylase
MKPEALRAAIQQDLAGRLKPFCVVPTIGTTSTTSIDPVREIVNIARTYRMWTHVDAAYGGAVCVAPEYHHLLDGIAEADSLVFNPHKWFFTPVDLSALYTRRPDILRRAFSLVPEYLRTTENPRALNYMDYGVPLGRRFRALKLWFVLRSFGREGIAGIIRSHIRWARELAAQIQEHPDFEVAAPVPFSLVCLRYKGSDEQNRELLERINRSGVAFLSHTVLNGRFVLRFAIGNVATTEQDIQRSWKHLQALAAELKTGRPETGAIA